MDGRSIRVLHLTSGNMYGGIESALTSLARLKQLAPNLEQEFAVCFPGRQKEELTSAGVRVYDVGAIRMSRPWTILAARSRLRMILRQSHPNLAITHGSWIHGLLGPVIRKCSIPLVTWVHGTLDRSRPLERIAAWTRPDLVIANSQHTKQAAKSVFSQSPIEVFYFPIASEAVLLDTATRERQRQQMDVADGQKVILHASRMESGKGHRTLLKALAKLNSREDWICWIAGGPNGNSESEYFSKLQQIASSLEINKRVKFLGQRSDVASLMSISDVFCQTNASPDSFGISFIEALYSGLPVITSDLGGGAEIVDESCGILTKPNDAASVAKAIEFLLDNTDRRQHLSSNGPNRADQLCNAQRQFSKLESILRHACSIP